MRESECHSLETLRKHPPATPIIRQAQSDFKVPGTDHIIAKGTQIFVDLYSLHRDPDNFPDPERFDPDRFAPEEVKKRNPMAFIPFGEGIYQTDKDILVQCSA